MTFILHGLALSAAASMKLRYQRTIAALRYYIGRFGHSSDLEKALLIR
jgi:hypothetical protein